MIKTKDCPRTSSIACLNDFEEMIEKGNLFHRPDGTIFNANDIVIVHQGIDTLRQLYSCDLKQDIVELLQRCYELRNDHQNPVMDIEIFGVIETFKVSGGLKGGYKYLLQNQAKTIVIMVGGKWGNLDARGNHLKIELSPQLLFDRSPRQIQGLLQHLACKFGIGCIESGIAVHLCVDIQGWQPPKDLDLILKTRARRISNHSGVTQWEIGDTVTFGKAQSFRFGSASGLQFACYDKMNQVWDTGSYYWLDKWKQATAEIYDGELLTDKAVYDPSQPVWRLEFRFHQSVIRQFQMFLQITKNETHDLSNITNLFDHLTGLWRYAMNNFRLDCSSSYIEPFWQYLRDDVVFFNEHSKMDYKRIYAEILPTISEKQIARVAGVIRGVFQKKKKPFEEYLNALKESGIFYIYFEVLDSLNKIGTFYELEAVLRAKYCTERLMLTL